MSRAALEQGLKEELGHQNGQDFVELNKLIDDANKWNILSTTGTKACRDLAKRCNSVLHEKPLQDDESALEILVGIRSLLEEIFSSEGRY